MRVKFCGITTVEDAREAVRLGAWAIGLNHWPQSPRRCDPGTAVAISAELRRKAMLVGVFVNAALDEIATAAEDAQLGDGAAARRRGAHRSARRWRAAPAAR